MNTNQGKPHRQVLLHHGVQPEQAAMRSRQATAALRLPRVNRHSRHALREAACRDALPHLRSLRDCMRTAE